MKTVNVILIFSLLLIICNICYGLEDPPTARIVFPSMDKPNVNEFPVNLITASEKYVVLGYSDFIEVRKINGEILTRFDRLSFWTDGFLTGDTLVLLKSRKSLMFIDLSNPNPYTEGVINPGPYNRVSHIGQDSIALYTYEDNIPIGELFIQGFAGDSSWISACSFAGWPTNWGIIVLTGDLKHLEQSGKEKLFFETSDVFCDSIKQVFWDTTKAVISSPLSEYACSLCNSADIYGWDSSGIIFLSEEDFFRLDLSGQLDQVDSIIVYKEYNPYRLDKRWANPSYWSISYNEGDTSDELFQIPNFKYSSLFIYHNSLFASCGYGLAIFEVIDDSNLVRRKILNLPNLENAFFHEHNDELFITTVDTCYIVSLYDDINNIELEKKYSFPTSSIYQTEFDTSNNIIFAYDKKGIIWAIDAHSGNVTSFISIDDDKTISFSSGLSAMAFIKKDLFLATENHIYQFNVIDDTLQLVNTIYVNGDDHVLTGIFAIGDSVVWGSIYPPCYGECGILFNIECVPDTIDVIAKRNKFYPATLMKPVVNERGVWFPVGGSCYDGHFIFQFISILLSGHDEPQLLEMIGSGFSVQSIAPSKKGVFFSDYSWNIGYLEIPPFLGVNKYGYFKAHTEGMRNGLNLELTLVKEIYWNNTVWVSISHPHKPFLYNIDSLEISNIRTEEQVNKRIIEEEMHCELTNGYVLVDTITGYVIKSAGIYEDEPTSLQIIQNKPVFRIHKYCEDKSAEIRYYINAEDGDTLNNGKLFTRARVGNFCFEDEITWSNPYYVNLSNGNLYSDRDCNKKIINGNIIFTEIGYMGLYFSFGGNDEEILIPTNMGINIKMRVSNRNSHKMKKFMGFKYGGCYRSLSNDDITDPYGNIYNTKLIDYQNIALYYSFEYSLLNWKEKTISHSSFDSLSNYNLVIDNPFMIASLNAGINCNFYHRILFYNNSHSFEDNYHAFNVSPEIELSLEFRRKYELYDVIPFEVSLSPYIKYRPFTSIYRYDDLEIELYEHTELGICFRIGWRL